MTQNKFTAAEICQIISDLRGEGTSDTSAFRLRAIDAANHEFGGARFWRPHLRRGNTIAGTGAADYVIGTTAYPMRDKGLTELFVSSTGSTNASDRYTLVDYNAYNGLVSGDPSIKICYEWYDQAADDWKVHINPAPQATDTITYSYYFHPAAVTQTTDIIVCPDPLLIANLALVYIYHNEDEPVKEAGARAESNKRLADCIADEATPAVNQHYSFGNNTTIGIGLY